MCIYRRNSEAEVHFYKFLDKKFVIKLKRANEELMKSKEEAKEGFVAYKHI